MGCFSALLTWYTRTQSKEPRKPRELREPREPRVTQDAQRAQGSPRGSREIQAKILLLSALE